MKKTINLCEFKESFKKCGRGNQFSEAALETLFKYFEEIEEETSTEIELDTISICCDYSEYNTLKDLQNDYDKINKLDDLEFYLITKNGSIIINAF